MTDRQRFTGNCRARVSAGLTLLLGLAVRKPSVYGLFLNGTPIASHYGMKFDIKHACGHIAEHQLFGKWDGRMARKAQLEREMCMNCRNRASAEANEAAGMPALQGSEKQIGWAESIRSNIIAGLEDFEELADSPDATESDKDTINRFSQWVRAQASASWWIDHRRESTREIFRSWHAESGVDK